MSFLPDSHILDEIYAPIDFTQMFQNERQFMDTNAAQWLTLLGADLERVEVYSTNQQSSTYEILCYLRPPHGSDRAVIVTLRNPIIHPEPVFNINLFLQLRSVEPLFLPAGTALGHAREGSYHMPTNEAAMTLARFKKNLEGKVINYYNQTRCGQVTRFALNAWCKEIVGRRHYPDRSTKSRGEDQNLNQKKLTAQKSTPKAPTAPPLGASTIYTPQVLAHGNYSMPSPSGFVTGHSVHTTGTMWPQPGSLFEGATPDYQQYTQSGQHHAVLPYFVDDPFPSSYEQSPYFN